MEKFEEVILVVDDYDLYGVYLVIDVCVVLSELMYFCFSGEMLEYVIEVSKIFIIMVVMLEMI